MKKLIRSFALVVAVILLTGCANSSNFVRPAKDSLAFGKSTRADVVSLVGKPTLQQESVPFNGEKFQVVSYSYIGIASFLGKVIPQRNLSYWLYNDKLVGEAFNSSIDGETTEFDGSKVASIEKGKSTRADVIALIGQPSGQFFYPLVKDKDGVGLVYEYSINRDAGMFNLFLQNNALLIVTLNASGVVTDVYYKKNGVEQVKS